MATHFEAKFDFFGQDESQLSFKQGDIIQVVSRLDSGWWDGICKGERGWFPSNFVREIYVDDSHDQPKQITWYEQIDSEGRHYYINAKTNEVSYVYPIQDEAFPNSESSDNILPPNWGIKKTHDNKVYYFNKETDETCWSLSEINPETGELINKNTPKRSSFSSGNEEVYLSTSPKSGELTWEKLSNDIFYCLQQLNNSAKLNRKELYISHSTSIVETIRTMLYASNTAKRDSVLLMNNKTLKQLHKSIMNALSKLVVTTKTASQIWPPPDSVSKMQNAANDVLASVKNFINTSKEMNLPLDASLVEESNMNENKNEKEEEEENQQQNSSKIIAQLEEYSKTISQSAQKLSKTIRMDENVSSEAIITETRNIVIDVGTFLSVIDEIDYDMLNSDIVVDFKLNRLAVCNSISGLVMATQTVVSTLKPSNFEEQILLSTELIEKAIKDFVISTKCILQEKESIDQQQYQKIFSDYNVNSNGSIISSSGSSNSRPTSTTSSELSTVINSSSASSITNLTSDTNATEVYLSPTASSQTGAYYDIQPRNKRSMSLSAVNGKDVIPENEAYSGEYDEAQLRTRTFSQRSLPIKLSENLNNMHISNNQVVIPARKISSTHSLNNSSISSASSIATNPLASSTTEFYDFDRVAMDQFSDERKTSSGKAKLLKFFGTETPDVIVNPTGDKKAKPWYLEYDYNPKDLVFNIEGKVKGGTFEALVERLTLHDSFDSNFTNTFLLTYRSFCTSTQLMNALIKRFTIPKPENLKDKSEINAWHEKKSRPIRLRVCNVVKSWFETYCIETDEEDQKAFQIAKEFFERQIEDDPTFTTVSKLLEKFDNGFVKKMFPTSTREGPVPIVPRSFRRIRFSEIDPLEIARQLTLMGSKLYNQIQPVECLNKAWSKKENSPAVNIKMMIEMSNQITGWVAFTILQEGDVKRRGSNLKHFIYIAEKCYSLNNFNTLMSILAGLNSAPIHRLSRTWELLNSKHLTIVDQLKRTMDRSKNFSVYREELHSVNPPCVPFLGVYLTDLTFIEDGNPDRLKLNENLINFSKQSKTADVIREIQQYQNQPYCLQPVPELQKFIIDSFQTFEDENDLYQMSLLIEPREREDEKITRLLLESGFL